MDELLFRVVDVALRVLDLVYSDGNNTNDEPEGRIDGHGDHDGALSLLVLSHVVELRSERVLVSDQVLREVVQGPSSAIDRVQGREGCGLLRVGDEGLVGSANDHVDSGVLLDLVGVSSVWLNRDVVVRGSG